jgi:hypothetical protein
MRSSLYDSCRDLIGHAHRYVVYRKRAVAFWDGFSGQLRPMHGATPRERGQIEKDSGSLKDLLVQGKVEAPPPTWFRRGAILVETDEESEQEWVILEFRPGRDYASSSVVIAPITRSGSPGNGIVPRDGVVVDLDVHTSEAQTMSASVLDSHLMTGLLILSKDRTSEWALSEWIVK